MLMQIIYQHLSKPSWLGFFKCEKWNFFYFVNVHKFCLIYFCNADVMFGRDGKASLQSGDTKIKIRMK